MPNKIWKGDAQAVAEVQTITAGGTWANGDTATMTMGGKNVVVTFGNGVPTTTQVAAALSAAFNGTAITGYGETRSTTGDLIPEFNEITASAAAAVCTLTNDTKGVPFTITATETSASGTLVVATATAGTGPKFWNNADNWAEDNVPIAGDDVIFRNSANDCVYGIDQNGLVLASLTIDQSFTGNIGLPRWNATGGYNEYRETHLKIQPTILTIGGGEGGGSGRIKIDTGTASAATVVIENTGAAAESGLEAVLLTGAHASNSLTVRRGSVGVSVLPGQTGTQPTVRIGSIANQTGDARVRIGSGVTLTTVTMAGGVVELNSAVTTITQTAGDLTHKAGAVTTIHIRGGTYRDRSTGTITTLNIASGGVYTRETETAGKTITNATATKGTVVKDPASTITWTNGLDLYQCRIADVTLDLGAHITLTPSAV